MIVCYKIDLIKHHSNDTISILDEVDIKPHMKSELLVYEVLAIRSDIKHS